MLKNPRFLLKYPWNFLARLTFHFFYKIFPPDFLVAISRFCFPQNFWSALISRRVVQPVWSEKCLPCLCWSPHGSSPQKHQHVLPPHCQGNADAKWQQTDLSHRKSSTWEYTTKINWIKDRTWKDNRVLIVKKTWSRSWGLFGSFMVEAMWTPAVSDEHDLRRVSNKARAFK